MRRRWSTSSRQSARRTPRRPQPTRRRTTPPSSNYTHAESNHGQGTRDDIRSLHRAPCGSAFQVLLTLRQRTRGRDSMARVVLADDHPLFLQALKEAIEEVGIEVVGL